MSAKECGTNQTTNRWTKWPVELLTAVKNNYSAGWQNSFNKFAKILNKGQGWNCTRKSNSWRDLLVPQVSWSDQSWGQFLGSNCLIAHFGSKCYPDFLNWRWVQRTNTSTVSLIIDNKQMTGLFQKPRFFTFNTVMFNSLHWPIKLLD